MTTWTMDQVAQAEGLYMRIVVDTDRHPDDLEPMRQAAASRMAKGLIQAAHPFAIELHPADLVVKWEPNESMPWGEVGEMRWRPSTTEVEMRGGQADGQRLQIRRVGDPINVAVNTSAAWMREDATAPVLTKHLTYELAGWNESERVWVYELR